MKLSQENVFRILEALAERGATSKEILVGLAQKKKRKAQLRKILKLLIKNKICRKRNNRYYLINEAASVPRPLKNRTPLFHQQSLKQRSDRELRGQILYLHGQQCIYSFQHQKQFEVAKDSLTFLLHGDLVSFDLKKNKQGEAMATVRALIERRISCLKGTVHSAKKGHLVFRPDYSPGPKQFKVLNNVPLRHGQQAAAWLDFTKAETMTRKAGGEARLVSGNSPYQHPLLEEILSNNNIPTGFSGKAVSECQRLPKAVRLGKKSQRRDLRALPFVTIDGEDAKDFDDAIYAEKEGENYRIWVSIADVAAYVPPGSAIDREAFGRGCSTYFPGVAYPMLPEPLSNGLCSLKEGVNRKTLTCESLVDKQGKTLSSRIYPSLNRIACRLTYTDVDRFFQTGEIKQRKQFVELSSRLVLYRDIGRALRKRRIRSGLIDFQLPETAFRYDKNKVLVDLVKSYQSAAMQVIEQFMLLANENVALFCDRHRLPIIWRNHAPPLPEKLETLKKLLWNNQIKLARLATGKDYNQALKLINSSPGKDFLEHAMLRSMSLAVYEVKREGHFGISSAYYCHFTSPIRRYPDLMVHRALKNHFEKRKPFKIQDYVAATASERERLSTAAERAAKRFFKLCFVADKIGRCYEGTISGLVKAGIFVEINHPYLEGFVSFATIHDDHYEYDEALQCIRGRNRKRRIMIGKKLKVLLTRLDWHHLTPEFDWICWREEI